MIASKIPGQNLTWPRSIRALIRHFGGVARTARATGLSTTMLSLYARGRHVPRALSILEALHALGWSARECPALADLPAARAAARAKRRARRNVTDVNAPPDPQLREAFEEFMLHLAARRWDRAPRPSNASPGHAARVSAHARRIRALGLAGAGKGAGRP